MKKLSLLKDNGLSRTYMLENGDQIIITLDEEYREIVVETEGGEHIGKIELDCDNDFELRCKIVWMYLDGENGKYLRKGIGRESLKYLKEYSGCKIIAEDNDGIKKDDGSHLTGNGPGFVNQMRSEGIIEKSFNYGG